MKLLISSLCLIASSLVSAQEKPVIVDEFGTVTCEDLLARTDNFQLMLNNNPSASGLVVISSDQDSPTRSQIYRTIIYHTLRRHDFDTTRLLIYRGESVGGTSASFWILPAGAELPKAALQPWGIDETIDLSKPVFIGSEDDSGVCPTFVPKDFANLIKMNSNVIGKLIVHAERPWSPSTIGVPWVDMFVKKYAIPRNRLRLVYGSRSKTISYTEFWLVPKRK